MLSPGCTVLASIEAVGRFSLTLALPFALKGKISLQNVPPQLVEHFKTVERGLDDQETEEDEEDNADGLAAAGTSAVAAAVAAIDSNDGEEDDVNEVDEQEEENKPAQTKGQPATPKQAQIKPAQTVRNFTNLFHVGQQLQCFITAVDSTSSKKTKIDLSIVPSVVNQGLKLDNLVKVRIESCRWLLFRSPPSVSFFFSF